mgnify:CR=1 FL=1
MAEMTPPLVLFSIAVAAVFLWMWTGDYQAARKGTPRPGALAGATPAPVFIVALSVAVSVLIVVLECAGEYALGIEGAQSTIPWYYLFAMLSAGIVEEILFRGYLVIQGRGRAALVASVVAFSIVFALVHGHFLPKGDDGARHLSLAAGPVWWSLILFVNALWWYFVRFSKWNPNHSLIPCFAGHMAGNLAVFAAKLLQGYVA